MATGAQLISRSLRLISMLDGTESAEGKMFEDAMLSLNGMLRRWEADGLSLGWQPIDNPDDVLPLPEEAEEAVTFNLAMLLAPEYGVVPSQIVAIKAETGHNQLRRDQAVATPIRPILAIPTPDTTYVYSGGLVNGGVVG